MSDKLDKEPTLSDVIEAINTSSTAVAVELHEIKQDIGLLKQDVSGLKQDVSGLKTDMTMVKATMATKEDLKAMETRLVTKDYLDEKMAEQGANLILLTRKEDRKVVALIHELKDNKV